MAVGAACFLGCHKMNYIRTELLDSQICSFEVFAYGYQLMSFHKNKGDRVFAAGLPKYRKDFAILRNICSTNRGNRGRDVLHPLPFRELCRG